MSDANQRQPERGSGGRSRPPSVDTPAWWDEAVTLATRAGRGEAGAAAELSGHLRPWVFRLAGRYFPYRGDADDVTQNVCIAVLRSVHQLDRPARLRSWLAAVTLNEVRSFYRQQSHEADRIKRAIGARPLDGTAPERTSVLGGLRVDLLDALDNLSRHHALVLGLRQLGVSYDEITAELAQPERFGYLFPERTDPVPEGTVRRWVNEARAAVSAGLAATDPVEG